MWEEFVQAIQTFLTDKANLGSPTKKGRKDKPHVILYYRFKKLIICHLGRIHNIHQRLASPFHLAEEDLRLGNLKFICKGKVDEVFGMPIPNELILNNIRNARYYNAYLEMVEKHDQKMAAEHEGKKKPATTKQPKPKPSKEKSSKPAPVSKPKETKEKPAKTSSTKQSQMGKRPPDHSQWLNAKDDASSNIVHESPSPANAKTSADTDKTNSRGDTEILQINEDQGKDVDDQPGPDPRVSRVAIAGPNLEPMHEEFMANVYPDVHGSLKLLANEHVILEEPRSSSRTLSSMKNLDDAYTFRDQFLNDKSTKDELGKLNMDSEVVSMVTVPIHQTSSSVPSLSTPIIDLSPPEPVSSTTQAQIFIATRMTTTTTVPLLPPLPQQSTSDSKLATFVKEVVHIALQALLKDQFRELPEADIKEILHQRMFKSGSYKSLPEHVALYKALEASMQWANRDEFLAEKDKSCKRCRDDQDPPSPPPDSDLSHRIVPDVRKPLPLRGPPEFMANVYPDVHGSLKLLADEHVILEEPRSSFGNLSSMKNLDDAYTFRDQFLNDKSTKDELGKLNMDSEVVSMVTVPIHQTSSSVPSLSTPIIDLSPPEPVSSTTQAQIFIATRMTTTTTVPLLPPLPQQSTSDSKLATFVKEVVHIALQALLKDQFRELPEADIKEILHQRMFKSGSYKSLPEHVALYKALEASMQWANRDEFLAEKDKSCKRCRDDQDPPSPPPDSDLSHRIVPDVRKPLPLRGPPDWDAFEFLFKEDYTIVSKPRAVIYRDINDQKKMMRETMMHKFSDDTLNRILEKLDHMVKDIRLFKYNSGMTTRIWSEDDRRRSKEIMEVIEHKLKLRRIFKSLKSFVGGRLRDVDYRLI
nr:hypothetical protein [Tanacetum cinerariifolium]